MNTNSKPAETGCNTNALPSRDAGSVSPSPRLAGAEGPNGERAGVRCINTPSKPSFNPWPYGIVAFFILLICALATVVVIASTHRDTMVSENYYEQELKFQDQIDGTARAQKCGAQVKLDASAGRLLLNIPATQLAQNFSGAIQFYRPSSPTLDREFPLTPNLDGSQALDVSKLVAGLWHVRVSWIANGQEYVMEQKITL